MKAPMFDLSAIKPVDMLPLNKILLEKALQALREEQEPQKAPA